MDLLPHSCQMLNQLVFKECVTRESSCTYSMESVMELDGQHHVAIQNYY